MLIIPTLVCAIYPQGVDSNGCLDFRLDSNAKAEEQGRPFGYSWYGDELIANRPSRYSQEEQLEILNNNPFFTLCLPKMQTPTLIKIMFQFTLIVLTAIMIDDSVIFESTRALNKVHFWRTDNIELCFVFVEQSSTV